MDERHQKSPEYKASKPVSREVTPGELVRFGKLVTLCLEQDISVRIEFETGRYVPGSKMFGPDNRHLDTDEIPEEDVVQGPQGFRVEVGMQSLNGEDGHDALYPSLLEAVNAGLQILYMRITEEQGEAAAKKDFAKYFNVAR